MSTHLHSDASFSNRPLLHARDGQHDTRKRAVRLCVVVVWWMAIAELVFRLAVWRGGQRQPSVVENVVESLGMATAIADFLRDDARPTQSSPRFPSGPPRFARASSGTHAALPALPLLAD